MDLSSSRLGPPDRVPRRGLDQTVRMFHRSTAQADSGLNINFKGMIYRIYFLGPLPIYKQPEIVYFDELGAQ